MPLLGLTGGVATGKSLFLQNLCLFLSEARVYDADAAVHRLLKTTCKTAVLDCFGLGIADEFGEIDRARLRAKVLYETRARRDLESILHPEVEREWRALAAGLRQAEQASHPQEACCKWLILAIPLLYEVAADKEIDVSVVVACRPDTQIRRIVEKRKLDISTAKAFLAAQWPIAEKIARCDYLIWNDGPATLLMPQAKLLSERLKTYARR